MRVFQRHDLRIVVPCVEALTGVRDMAPENTRIARICEKRRSPHRDPTTPSKKFFDVTVYSLRPDLAVKKKN